MTFRGKLVLVTGAASGIGADTATHFAKLDASLALVDKNMSSLVKVADKCKQISKQEPFKCKADLTNEMETKNLIELVMNHCERLDALINCAGILEIGTIENTSLAQYDKVFNINVRSMYHLTMLAAPYLIETKGCIVNVSSVSGLRSYSGALAYSMSKSAVDQFTRCVALDLASKGVRVNSVNPGFTGTELYKRAGVDDATYAKYVERAKLLHPLGRSGTVEEVAKSIAFLASDNASFTTGVNLPVDGGRVAFGLR